MNTWPISWLPPMPILHPILPESVGHTDAIGTTLATPKMNGTSSAVWPSANLAIFVPIQIGCAVTITVLVWNNGAAVSGNIDVGIYDAAGTRLVSSGSTAQSGTSVIQQVNITDTLIGPGLYYWAMALDNTTGAVFRATAVNAEACRCMGLLQQATAFALPATATFASMAQNYIPILGALISPRTLV